MIDTADLDHQDAQQLREMVLSLRKGAVADKLEIERRDHEIAFKQAAMDDALQQWLAGRRRKVPDGSATAKAIDYSLKRWPALTRYIVNAAQDVSRAIEMLRQRPAH